MAAVFQKTRQILFPLLCVLLFSSLTDAEEASIFNEFTIDHSWLSDEYSYDDYIINGEPSPLVSGSLSNDYQQICGSYSLFFTPIIEDETIPIDLRRFYARPTTLYLDFSIQPENEATRIQQNLEQNYRAVTIEDQRARNARADLEVYFRKNTGLLLHVRSAKEEDTSRFSNSLGSRGNGETDEIQRYYGIGLSQYLFGDLHLSFLYTILDFEYVRMGKTWEEDSPGLVTKVGQGGDTEGKELSITGKYIVNKHIGIQAIYRYMNYDSHSNMMSYYNNFPTGETFFDDDARNHTLGTSVELYWGKNTSFQLGGSLTRYTMRRVYETDQIIDYDWDIWGIHSSLLYYLNRHLGVWLGYQFLKRNAGIETWHPKTENDPRTTFQLESDLQTIQLGFVGRF